MTRIRIVNQPTRAAPAQPPAAAPLTHHDILRLVGPFTRRGRHLDMGASERGARRLVFKPIEHEPVRAGGPRLGERFVLHVSERGNYRMERVLTPVGEGQAALSATVTAAGPDLEALLAQVEGFDTARLFPDCGGCAVQRSYRLMPPGLDDAEPGRPWETRLVEAAAVFDGVRLNFDADLYGMPVKVRLIAPPGRHLRVPRDLFAVLGRHWRTVEDYTDHWRSSIRVAKREPRRTRDVEAKFERTVRHLAETLAQSPAAFHARHRRERWVAAMQRGVPLLAVLLMIGAALSLANVPLSDGNVFRMLVFHLPPIMLLLFFLVFDELPPFELPRVPRALEQEDWLTGR
jgi:hypothetical protein